MICLSYHLLGSKFRISNTLPIFQSVALDHKKLSRSRKLTIQPIKGSFSKKKHVAEYFYVRLGGILHGNGDPNHDRPKENINNPNRVGFGVK